jgi:nicotinate phosphoribosyltransferase
VAASQGLTASTALHTDHYELTMLDAALGSGIAGRTAVFEAFVRRLPHGRGYGVVGGVGRLMEAVEQFRFGDAELSYLQGRQFLSEATMDWLAQFRFSGSIDAYHEGELYFPYSPVLTVTAPFGEALLLETLVLSVLNFDSAVAAAASRMLSAAVGHPLIEMGGRRVHEEAAVAAARIACALGFAATSNLEAGRRWGVATAGTSSHAFTLAHADEASAFAAQIARLGVETTLLVDTFDTDAGVRAAVSAARDVGAAGPGAIRLDSGDLAGEARRARAALDSLGAKATSIVVSGDLDEFAIAALEGARRGRPPIDAYGVGTKLTTGSGAPSAEMVYKLVAVADDDTPSAPLRPVSKRSVAKATLGGRKVAWRLCDADGRAFEERVVTDGVRPALGQRVAYARPLQLPMVLDGTVVLRASLTDIGEVHHRALLEIGPGALELQAAAPILDASPALSLEVPP